jgi:hypothetical protein
MSERMSLSISVASVSIVIGGVIGTAASLFLLHENRKVEFNVIDLEKVDKMIRPPNSPITVHGGAMSFRSYGNAQWQLETDKSTYCLLYRTTIHPGGEPDVDVDDGNGNGEDVEHDQGGHPYPIWTIFAYGSTLDNNGAIQPSPIGVRIDKNQNDCTEKNSNTYYIHIKAFNAGAFYPTPKGGILTDLDGSSVVRYRDKTSPACAGPNGILTPGDEDSCEHLVGSLVYKGGYSGSGNPVFSIPPPTGAVAVKCQNAEHCRIKIGK